MPDKTLEQRLEDALNELEAHKAAEAKKAQDAERAAAEAKFATKEDLTEAIKSLGEQIAAQIAAEVEKALPVARPEGAGRQGENTQEEDPFEANPVAHVAKKAAGERSQAEKDFIWALTRQQMEKNAR